MSNEPHMITPAALIRILSHLGIESDLKDIQSIHVEPGKVTVTRMRRNEDGLHYTVGPNELATETVTFAVVAK